jgi:hypothetical protein
VYGLRISTFELCVLASKHDIKNLIGALFALHRQMNSTFSLTDADLTALFDKLPSAFW